MDDLRIIDLLNEIKDKCIKNIETFSKELNLTVSEYEFFIKSSKLAEFDCRNMQKELNLSPSRFSRIVDKLVNNGYVERKHSIADRRHIIIKYTEEGEKMLQEVMKRQIAYEERILGVFTGNEYKRVIKDFKKIIDEL